MGKIVYLMGKSSSGKDTIFKELMNQKVPQRFLEEKIELPSRRMLVER